MITYGDASTIDDLISILELQRQNLAAHLTDDQMAGQGFVTVHHQLEDLVRMSEWEKSIIARQDQKLVAYILAMTIHAREFITVLKPMFDLLDQLKFRGKRLAEHSYILVGQVCVHKDFRGSGVFTQSYDTFKIHFQHKYDFALTEIAARNSRSMRAHERVGFETIHTYTDPDGEVWNIVAWDWN
jgi:hypothetical protein